MLMFRAKISDYWCYSGNLFCERSESQIMRVVRPGLQDAQTILYALERFRHFPRNFMDCNFY